MIDKNTTTSIIDDTKTLRVVRSHRAKPSKQPRRVSRRALLTTLAVLAVGAVAPVSEGGNSLLPVQEASAAVVAESAPHAMAPEPPAIAPRTEPASRSKRAMNTRSYRINAVIKYAMAQRGDRYKWGATGPNAYDCSGLVVRSLKKGAAKNLPHYTGALLKKGKKIKRSQLQKGDLVFPSKHHVGIYIGGNKMIVASTGAGKVKIQKVYSFYTARRVL